MRVKAKVSKSVDIVEPISELRQFTDYIEIGDDNVVKLNRALLKLKHSDIHEISAEYKNKKFRVDLKSGDICVNDEKIDLELDKKLLNQCKKSGFRWINFRRHKVSYVMGGKAGEVVYHGIGWQSTAEDKNIQRFILINENTGEWKLHKKR